MRWTGVTVIFLLFVSVSGYADSLHEARHAQSTVEQSDVSAQALIDGTLRIMPLGDSITRGSLSSNDNGYRRPLQSRMDGAGITTDFIGSLKTGSMNDNDHEGHSGSFLSEIKNYALLSINAQPNVVLLHAGTNDMDKNIDVANARYRLSEIIDLVYRNCPDAVILVAQIIPCRNANMQARVDAYNAAIPDVVKKRVDAGRKVMAVDMSRLLNTSTDLADDKHPNDQGYSKIGNAWYEAILRAHNQGWITSPPTSKQFSGVGLEVDIGQGATAPLEEDTTPTSIAASANLGIKIDDEGDDVASNGFVSGE